MDWDRHYSPELAVGLLKLWGVEVKGMSVSAVSRQSRTGKALSYFSVVGSVAAMESLEAQSKVLKTRGWRVGWGRDCQIWETGSGAGVSAGLQSVTHECSQASRRR